MEKNGRPKKNIADRPFWYSPNQHTANFCLIPPPSNSFREINHRFCMKATGKGFQLTAWQA